MTNADPVEVTLEYDWHSQRVKRITARMLNGPVCMPSLFPREPEPPRWPRVVRRWASKHR